MDTSGPAGRHAASRATWRWVVRQTALGLALLVVFVAGGAWLLNASIDPEIESTAPIAEPAAGE